MFLPNRRRYGHQDKMDATTRKLIKDTNWLAHRWPVQINKRAWENLDLRELKIEDYDIRTVSDPAKLQETLEQITPICLARWIAETSELHPAIALIVSGKVRLGRIPPERWYGYDVLPLERFDIPRRALSARARAMFPDMADVLIVVTPRHLVSDLRLQPPAKDERHDRAVG